MCEKQNQLFPPDVKEAETIAFGTRSFGFRVLQLNRKARRAAVAPRGGNTMLKMAVRTSLILAGTLSILGVLLLAAGSARTQEKPKSERFTARARGQNRASGKMFSLEITIDSYSTPADQKLLIDAFQSGGHDALVKALSKMDSRGRVALTGTVGYKVAYVRTFPTENGRRIRLITDRPIQFKEAYVGGRTTDYDLSAVELNLDADPKKSDGSLIVAGKFKVDKDGQVIFESYGSGPWKLTNIIAWK